MERPEVFSANTPAVHWVRRGLAPNPVSKTQRDFLSLPSLESLTFPSSSFFDASPLQSSFASFPRPSPFGTGLACLGFRPHRDFTEKRPLSAKVPGPSLRSALRLSQPLGGLLRSSARRLVSSRCHVQGSSRSGASPSPQPPSLVGRSLPPGRWIIVAHRPKPAATSDAPRLRGFAPRRDTFYRPNYSPCRQPLPSSGYSPPGAPSPAIDSGLPGALRS